MVFIIYSNSVTIVQIIFCNYVTDSMIGGLQSLRTNLKNRGGGGAENRGKFLPRIRNPFEIEPDFVSELHLSGPQFLYKQGRSISMDPA